MKRFLSTILCLCMLCSITAFAADTGTTYDVKYGAPVRSTYNALLAAVAPDGYTESSQRPSAFTADGTFTVDGVEYGYHIVRPEYSYAAIPTIAADSDYNASAKSLKNYVKSNLTLTQTNTAWDAAIGEAPDTEPYLGDFTWNSTGGSYRIPVSFNGAEFSVAVSVTELDNDVPEVYIGENGVVECTPSLVEYSTDRSSWSQVKDGSAISSKCYGQYVYFRTPATQYVAASDYVRVYCREQQSAPTGKLQLSATSYSITLENASDFKGCQFSIDGTYYSSKTSWTGLSASTKYTVYARYPGDSDYWASQPVSSSITTAEGISSDLTYQKVSTSSTIYMQAEGVVKYTVSNKQLTAAYTDSDVRTLKNDITTTSRKTDVVTTLDAHINEEEGEDRDYTKIKYTMPSGMGLLQLRLHTPWFTVIRDTETTEVVISSGASDGGSTVKAWASGLSHIYKVATTKAGEVTILFPWEWPDRADLDGLQVSYISSDGKDSRILNYVVVTDGIKFVMPASGYFAIRNLNRAYPTIPFLDSQSSWAYSYICHAYETGLVAGTSATTFDPDGLVTRSQLIMLLARMRGYDNDKWYGDLPYTDVTENDWYASALSFVYATGALKPDGSEFKPNEPVTREDTAALVEKLFPYGGTLWEPFNTTDRDTTNTYALKAIDSLYTTGIMNGTSASTFSPKSTLTRAEVVTILYRLQVSDYWQTKTATLSKAKLDGSKVKSSPNVWIDDGAKYLETTTDVQAAMQYFQTTTGVRPYLVTTTTEKSAKDIYKQKFTDNGHMVLVITKLSDRGGMKAEFSVGSDAAEVIGLSEISTLSDSLTAYWENTTLTSEEALSQFFRRGADDVMQVEVTTTASKWSAPQPVRDRNTTTAAVREWPAMLRPAVENTNPAEYITANYHDWVGDQYTPNIKDCDGGKYLECPIQSGSTLIIYAYDDGCISCTYSGTDPRADAQYLKSYLGISDLDWLYDLDDTDTQCNGDACATRSFDGFTITRTVYVSPTHADGTTYDT